MTSGTQRLIASAFDGYSTSVRLLPRLAHRAAHLSGSCTGPRPAETVVLLVSDRHDNVGMDPVARAIGDRAERRSCFDAGDDTSTGGAVGGVQPGVARSTRSATSTALYQVPGNHDNGTFVAHYLAGNGFTCSSGEPLERTRRHRLLGVGDPRSSGLGNWRTTSGITFDRAGPAARRRGVPPRRQTAHRVSTLLVHEASMAATGARRGCVDLVLGGSPPRPGRAPTGSPARTATSGCPSRTVRPAARPMPWLSAPSCAATPRSPWSRTGRGGRSACSRCRSTPPV